MSEYSQTPSEGRISRVSSQHTRRSISKSLGNQIDDKHFREESDRKNIERAKIKALEKKCTSELIELGKICRFVEHFDKISLAEQNIPQVGPFEDPTIMPSFKQGYTMAESFINAGFSYENYLSFVENYENKFRNNTNHK